MKSLREVLEMVGLRAIVGIVRGRIVLSIVERKIGMSWSFRRMMERRNGYDVYDQGGSSASSTSGLRRFWLVAATSTAIVAAEISLLYWEKRMAKMGRL